jgi:hypothetical protein
MIAKIIWWDQHRTQGVMQVVNEQGIVKKFFLLESKIVQRPAEIRTGMLSKFTDALEPKRPDLLPVAINVVVFSQPLVIADVEALNASQIEVRG